MNQEHADNVRLLEDLLELADPLGVEVRRQAMGGEGGGLAILRGRRVLFIDTDARIEQQLEKSADGLSRLAGEMETIYVKPAIRDLLGLEE
ncbi:MAG: hypothetical protein BIFFINMI_01280 [Phycisphaerae bacterium]|nr:hypothetical protein [Phycisphaerae bacterium]